MADDKSQSYSGDSKIVSNNAERLVKELRLMAEGQGEYRCFFYMSPKIKGIWKAAADWIENAQRGSPHQ